MQAAIEFDLEGNILTANDNFLDTMGYRLDEIVGQHHSMFCAADYAASQDYRTFWKHLANGEFQSGEFKRHTKNGSEVWINASYNPVFDLEGRPIKVVKFATDITESTREKAESEARMQAVDRVQAVIEFDLDGHVLVANENFLNAMGYSLDEIVGKHHRMFCDPEFANSAEYRALWQRLKEGLFDSGEYMRIHKDGHEVWINASYNPVFDVEGNVLKVVKFATDITEQTVKNADYEGKINAISMAQAVIEFNLDGTVIVANDNFLSSFGYQLDEVAGKHHRMFCKPELAASAEYENFWRDLSEGKPFTGEYERIAKDGRSVWIRGNYNPRARAERRARQDRQVCRGRHGGSHHSQRAPGKRRADQHIARSDVAPNIG